MNAKNKDLEKPQWLDLPEEEKQRHTYWTTTGDLKPETPSWLGPLKALGRRKTPFYSVCHHSKEEAEARAVENDVKFWVWDKQPAQPTTLQALMDGARRAGRAGVVIEGWRNGRWEKLKVHLANEPLQGGEE